MQVQLRSPNMYPLRENTPFLIKYNLETASHLHYKTWNRYHHIANRQTKLTEQIQIFAHVDKSSPSSTLSARIPIRRKKPKSASPSFAKGICACMYMDKDNHTKERASSKMHINEPRGPDQILEGLFSPPATHAAISELRTTSILKQLTARGRIYYYTSIPQSAHDFVPRAPWNREHPLQTTTLYTKALVKVSATSFSLASRSLLRAPSRSIWARSSDSLERRWARKSASQVRILLTGTLSRIPLTPA